MTNTFAKKTLVRKLQQSNLTLCRQLVRGETRAWARLQGEPRKKNRKSNFLLTTHRNENTKSQSTASIQPDFPSPSPDSTEFPSTTQPKSSLLTGSAKEFPILKQTSWSQLAKLSKKKLFWRWSTDTTWLI